MHHCNAAHTDPRSAGLPATPGDSLAASFLRDVDHCDPG